MDEETTKTLTDEENNEQTPIIVNLTTEVPEEILTSLADMIEQDKYLNRLKDKGIVNSASGASFVTRDSGQTNISSSSNAQYKLSPIGKTAEQSLESTTITVRKNINADEIIINGHKLNPQIYEMTDLKQVFEDENTAIGNFQVTGTVLTKCWEPHLKRYVLMRRSVRIPLFSPKLSVPVIASGLNIQDPFAENNNLKIEMNEGYQVTGKISDAKNTQTSDTKTVVDNNTSNSNADLIKTLTGKAGDLLGGVKV